MIAVVAAILTAMVISLLHAWLSISVKADQIISGTIINIAAFGLTGYLNTLISRGSPTGAGAFTDSPRRRATIVRSSAGSSRCSSTRAPSPCP